MVEPLPSAIECARLYLAPPIEAFWRWAGDQRAIEWQRSGGTILVREELEYLIRHRVDAGMGLPPLQAIVLLAALLRDRERVVQLGDFGEVPDLDHIWRRIRGDASARATCYDWMLFISPCNTPDFAARVAVAMDSDLPDGLLEPREFRAVRLDEAIKWIREGTPGLTAERIELLARTGVDRVPTGDGVELLPRDVAAGVLQQLVDDTRLTGFVEVVREVMAAFRVPRLSLLPEQQEQGGVSGLSNRGSLDRLALSELAHDDHVLAVRIATNEALYVEREVPPATPRYQRRILLDCGVRMWGTPRVLAVAVAIALAATAEAQADVSVSVAREGSFRAIDLGNREGVVAQLERYDDELDLRRALPSFLVAPEQMDGDEPVVIVHRDTAKDRAVRALLATTIGRRVVVDIDDVGTARLWVVSVRGWQLISEVALSIDHLVTRSAEHAPLYYGVDPAPLPPRPRAAPAQIVAIAWSQEKLGLRSRRGRMFTVRLTARGHLILQLDTSKLEVVPLLPSPQSHDPPLTCAELGNRHTVFCDGRLLHFVPRYGDDRQLSVYATLQAKLIGYCSRSGETLQGRALYDRMLAIVREAS